MATPTKQGAMIAPVVFLLFNRPDTTQRVFEQIRKAAPSKLFIVADGPRHSLDEQLCNEARSVVESVDWECEVFRNYSDTNLGCRNRVVSGISWAFDYVEDAIILEDDCLPSDDFFTFCTELLQRYRSDERVMMITGDNFQCGNVRGDATYYFSKYCHIWGWATWKRAWKLYDPLIADWPHKKDRGFLESHFETKKEREFWNHYFTEVHTQSLDTWDFQWAYTCLKHSGLSATPQRNLVSNLGFREDATHTKGKDVFAELPVYPIGDLTHPRCVEPHIEADRFDFEYAFGGTKWKNPATLSSRMRNTLRKVWMKFA